VTPGELSPAEYDRFRSFIQKTAGISLSPGRRRTFERKIARRMKEIGVSTFGAYYRLVTDEDGADERARMLELVAIGQTSFFRGDRQFSFVAENLIPEILEKKPVKKRLRFWSAGCSLGQEPYSIAMLVAEKTRAVAAVDAKILATDINEESLRTASRGEYPKAVEEQVPSLYLSRYFKPIKGPSGGYRVRPRLRKLVVFRRLNLLQAPYPMAGPLDGVWLRNVMIYFSQEDKRRILREMHRLLAPGGFLCLGGSESLLGLDDRFSLIRHAVYRKVDA